MKIHSLAYQPNYYTHTSPHAERLHAISEAIFLPARLNVQLAARIIQPLPGKDKDSYFIGVAIRIASLAASLILLPISVISTVVGFSLRCIDHLYRPSMCYMNLAKGERAPVELTKEHPLHVRSHNLGFVSSSMSTLGDLRHPEERAKEVIESIIGDPNKPEIIFFQEAFHEDATRMLCEGIKSEYPYIIYNIHPHLSGFSSGTVVASKYPLKDIEFEPFEKFVGPEALTPRGVIKVSLDSSKGPVHIYAVHTQALHGEERSKARLSHLEHLKKVVDRHPQDLQIIVGDFNTSRLTIWGEDNIEPKNQAEGDVLERLEKDFDDLYLRDHEEFTGKRTEGAPQYLDIDNARMQEQLEEPSGSWYYGPFADKGFLLYWKMRLDRLWHGREEPKKVPGIAEAESLWGRDGWHAKQTANTCRLDYILLPKNSNKLDGRVEIRRTIVPKGCQSASSDHLPIDGQIWAV